MITSLPFFITLIVSTWAGTLPSPLLVTYWGQDVNQYQKPLRSYCDMGYNVIVLGFIDHFGNTTFNLQMDSVSCSTNNTSGCADIASDIKHCQSHNVKILMSMGGATVHDCGEHCKGEYRFDNIYEANKTAEHMYYMFFGGKASGAYPRPFGDVILDGVDLDIEEKPEGSQTYQWYYDKFVARLRELSHPNDLIVSAAPECHYGCASRNCNPLEQTVNLTAFDYLLIQFYNDPYCSLLEPGFNSSLDYWLNLQGPNSGVKIVLGVAGDNRSQNVADAKYFVPPEKVISIYHAQHGQNRRVGGIGIWQASTNTTEPGFFHIIEKGVGLLETATSSATTSTTSSFATSTSSAAATGATATDTNSLCHLLRTSVIIAICELLI